MKHRYFYFLTFILLNINIANAQGTRLWATYYGGSATDEARGMVVDDSQNVYISGHTTSSNNISTSGSFQNTNAGLEDGFFVKFNSSGSRQFATYFGGSGNDRCNSIAVDATGNIYVAGSTDSGSGIASGGFQNTLAGGTDAFLAKFDPSGNLIWATYYGGTLNDQANNVSTDAAGNIYIAGNTASTEGIATKVIHQNTYGGGTLDAFLIKFDPSGNRLWATYYGGSEEDKAFNLSIDEFGNVYMVGATRSTSGIASGGFQNTHGGGTWDAFLVKFDSSGNRVWATYYGGSGAECNVNVQGIHGVGVSVDISNNIYFSGYTSSTTGIATSSAFQTAYGGGNWDAFLVKFDPSGNRLWATYYGGTRGEEFINVSTDALGNVFIGGDTYSSNGIYYSGHTTFSGSLSSNPENEFVARFDSEGNRICATYYGRAHDENGLVVADKVGNVYLLGHTYTSSGIATTGAHQTTLGGGVWDVFLLKSGPCNVLLEIELVDFFGEKYGLENMLYWETVSEINVKKFVLQKSKNITDWETFGTILASGNSSINRNYSFIDSAPYSTTYYRIGIVDSDSSLKYSKTILVVNKNIEDAKNLLVYPNPTTGKFVINSEKVAIKNIDVYDLLGSKVLQIETNKQKKLEIDLFNYPNGVYFINCKTDNETHVVKIIKQ